MKRTTTKQINLNNDRLLTTDEIARLLGFHPQTIRKYCRLGIIPSQNISIGRGGPRGNRYRVRYSVIKKWVKTHGIILDSSFPFTAAS